MERTRWFRVRQLCGSRLPIEDQPAPVGAGLYQRTPSSSTTAHLITLKSNLNRDIIFHHCNASACGTIFLDGYM